jgi:transposase-like protein
MEPLAKRMYADGYNLAQISREMGVSDTSLRKWKEDSRVPGEELDGWDTARMQKRGHVQRLRDILEEQLMYVESLLPEDRTSKTFDGLSKIAALVERIDKMEEEIRRKTLEEAADTIDGAARQAGISEETIRVIRRDVLRMAG